MLNAFRISYALKNTYRVNGIIYSVKQIPLLKKILPDTLYRITWIKVLATIISLLWELVSAFAGKYIYLFMLSNAATGLAVLSGQDPFLHIFLLLTVIGGYFNTFMFNPTNDKYYAMILMRMDAKKYTLSDYTYSMLRVFFGFLPFVFIFGPKHGLTVPVCAALPLFVVAVKLIFAWIYLLRYEKSGDCVNENLPTKLEWILTAVLLAAAFGLPYLKVMIPDPVLVILILPVAVGGVYAAIKLSRFRDYREMYQILLASKKDGMDYTAAKRDAIEKQSRKYISADTGSVSTKQGFEYLNELFIKRHRKILWRSSKRVSLFALGAVAAALVSFRLNGDIANGINGMLMHRLPYFVFVMYAINRGRTFTQALFMNCDDALLTYSFYKKPIFILRLFRIRLWEIIKVNLLPAAVISAGLPLIIYFSGGTKNPLDYVVIPLTVLLLSAFFSVHYLACYYLLQPYNAGTEIKSGTYSIVMFLTYLVCVICMQVKVNTLIFGIIVCCACVVYCIAACILVYKLAYKTFKIRA